jgi:hypothetical protein
MSTFNVRSFKNKSDGNKMINQYKVLKTLGKGAYATVKLVEDPNSE